MRGSSLYRYLLFEIGYVFTGITLRTPLCRLGSQKRMGMRRHGRRQARSPGRCRAPLPRLAARRPWPHTSPAPPVFTCGEQDRLCKGNANAGRGDSSHQGAFSYLNQPRCHPLPGEPEHPGDPAECGRLPSQRRAQPRLQRVGARHANELALQTQVGHHVVAPCKEAGGDVMRDKQGGWGGAM